MLKLGWAQGVAIAAALQRDIPIFEYAPRKIKMSVTGSGTASKEQIALLLGKFMTLHTTSEMLDETDAIAIAYCHYLQSCNPLKNPKERLIKIKVSCRYYEKGSYKHNLRTCTIK